MHMNKPITRLQVATAILTGSLLSGCANLTSIKQELTVVEGAKATAIDAKQRVVFSRKRSSMASGDAGTSVDDVVICAEPSPDALSAVSASLSGTRTSGDSAAAQFALALAEQASSIGLRTQSIQLMRDTMYRACEAYMAGGIDKVQFFHLQRRFQNLTLGLLAIEQLTGPLKAEQVALSTTAASATGDNVEAETRALSDARANLDDAKEALAKEEDKSSIANDAATKKRTEATKARTEFDKLADDKKTEEAKKNVEALESSATELEEAATEQAKKVAAERTKVDTQEKNVKDAQVNLDLARGRVRAYASGIAKVGPSGSRVVGVNKDTAESVTKIVGQVLAASGREENCHDVISDWLGEKDSPHYRPEQVGVEILKSCIAQQKLEAAEKAKAIGLDPAAVQKLLDR